jgi:hypothetical protein
VSTGGRPGHAPGVFNCIWRRSCERPKHCQPSDLGSSGIGLGVHFRASLAPARPARPHPWDGNPYRSRPGILTGDRGAREPDQGYREHPLVIVGPRRRDRPRALPRDDRRANPELPDHNPRHRYLNLLHRLRSLRAGSLGYQADTEARRERRRRTQQRRNRSPALYGRERRDRLCYLRRRSTGRTSPTKSAERMSAAPPSCTSESLSLASQ